MMTHQVTVTRLPDGPAGEQQARVECTCGFRFTGAHPMDAQFIASEHEHRPEALAHLTIRRALSSAHGPAPCARGIA
jgi:hypothetical protein